MGRWKLRGAIAGGVFGLLWWAIDKIVEPIGWLPFVVAPLCIAVSSALGIWWILDRERLVRRPSLPGFGVHMAIALDLGVRGRRRYLFEFGMQRRAGAAAYISASDRFVFEIRDAAGEAYTLELPLGRGGVPLNQPMYLGLEAGVDRERTIMRIIIDGAIVQQRALPFQTTITAPDVGTGTLGSSLSKESHGAFTINNMAIVGATLSEVDARGMASYQRALTTPALHR